jgi:hypothetical protein
MWQADKRTPGGQGIEDAMGHLDGKALFAGEERPLDVRVAWHQGALWYDLGASAVSIAKERWEIVAEPPILFKRFKANSPQVAPVSGGDIREFLAFTRLKTDRDRLLLLVQLAASFVPGFPRAAQVISGDQGASKTTRQELFKAVVDPSIALTLSPPDTAKDFVQQASHHWVLFYDNLASLPQWLSDCLCKAVTGQGFSKRELFSDDDDILYAFRRVVGLNAIHLVVERPDLLDRTLLVRLERIPNHERRERNELWQDFEQKKPRILGGIFDVLAQAMAIHPTLRLKALPRMADFARWGEAIAQAMGHTAGEFLAAYDQNVQAQNETALEASPIAQAIIDLAGESPGEVFKGTPSALLEKLTGIAERLKLTAQDRRSKWPKDARWLWRRIVEVRPNFMAVGIVAQEDRSNMQRTIIMTRTIGENDVTNDTVVTGRKNQRVASEDMLRDVATSDDSDDTSDDTGKPDVTSNHLNNMTNNDSGDSDDIFQDCPSADNFEEF